VNAFFTFFLILVLEIEAQVLYHQDTKARIFFIKTRFSLWPGDFVLAPPK